VLFNSAEYLLFFVATLVASWLLASRPRARLWLLTLASFYFYGSNNGWVLVLLLATTQLDYHFARWIEDTDDPRRRRRLLTLSMIGNLGLLGFFKYFNFFAGSAVTAAGWFGAELGWTPWDIVLPVGISFYTFQSMSYTIDVYRRELKAERSWLRFAFFVAFFPQLIAGPIVRASDFLHQVPKTPTLDEGQLERALMLIARGLVKKIVLADFLCAYADRAFDHPLEVGALEAWVGLYAFTFQIYFDFSGYSDIAIGCSRLLGYDLCLNFNLPYAATSFSDFWRRWHISLSTFLRDYLYIPLGGNRGTSLLTYRNLMLTMLLGGLWHGAAWHFVLWGLFHGLYLAIERRLGVGRGPVEGAVALTLRRLVVFHAVVITWLLFRAQDTQKLVDLSRALLGGSAAPGLLTNGMVAAMVLVVLGLWTQWIGAARDVDGAFLRLPVPVKGLIYCAVAIAVVVFNSGGAKAFIYFAF
jgi:alginate O-acetyltransferase complex protein AlgI